MRLARMKWLFTMFATALAGALGKERNRGNLQSEDLKVLLAAAPLEGVDLDRSRDVGRTIELTAGKNS
jgi:hypothetical protein